MLNLLLLIWSILSTVAWLILLSYKIYKFLLRDYASSLDEIDERFAVHESDNSNAQLYMPWLDPHSHSTTNKDYNKDYNNDYRNNHSNN
jgi:hypothetical protein